MQFVYLGIKYPTAFTKPFVSINDLIELSSATSARPPVFEIPTNPEAYPPSSAAFTDFRFVTCEFSIFVLPLFAIKPEAL